MHRPTIDVVLFDLGNVILDFNHFQIGEKLAAFSQKRGGQDPSAIFTHLFDLRNGLVNLYETGKISSKKFFDVLKERFQLDISFEAFALIWNDIFVENRKVSEIIRSLKEQKRLGLISNTNPLHFDYALATFPVVRVFDRWILSHEVGFKKPAAEIFQAALRWASTEPQRILFIDDIPRHVEVAISLGMQGIHFVSAENLEKVLVSVF